MHPVVTPQIQPVVAPQMQPVLTPQMQHVVNPQMPSQIQPIQQYQISHPPSYPSQPEYAAQVPGSIHGGVQYVSPSVVYPVSYPQKIPPGVNQPQQPTMVYGGSPSGGGFVMLPQGVMLAPQVMAMPPVNVNNKGVNNPVVQPQKQNIVVLPTNFGQPPRTVYVQNTVAQPQQQQQYYQQAYHNDSGYTTDLQKKKQIEEDEALARLLQDEENRNGANF